MMKRFIWAPGHLWHQFVLVVLVIFGIKWAFEGQPTVTGPKSQLGKRGQPAFDRQALADFALSFLCTPYRPKGKSPDGFDCSGYTGYVFRRFGIQLPASSSGQAKIGSQVSQDSLAIGDLVFFSGPSSRPSQKIGHVGVVTTVDPPSVYFAHSTTHGGVMVDSLSNPYYRARLIATRRAVP